MRAYEYNITVDVNYLGQGGGEHRVHWHGEAPESTYIVAIVDPGGKCHAADWVKVDALGEDRELQARVLGLSLTRSTARGPGTLKVLTAN